MFSYLRKNVGSMILLFSAVLFFSSCLKNDATDVPQQEGAGLMAFNLAPAKNAVGFAVSGNVITYSPLGYTNYTGGYVNLFPGNRVVQSFDYGSNNVIDSSSANFMQGKYYSVFLTGDSGTYKNVLVQDNYDSLAYASNTSFVRYINAINDTTGAVTVKVTAAGNDVFNGLAPYRSVTAFKPVASGDVSITANNESGLNATRTITLEAGKAYTVLLVGKPGATDPTQQVQVKYIYNVNVTP